jgi:hypothetical protein
MTDVSLLPLARTFRRAALPLAAYYTVTLVLPLANGAARADTPFVRHALVVLIVPFVMVIVLCAVRAVAQAGVPGPENSPCRPLDARAARRRAEVPGGPADVHAPAPWRVSLHACTGSSRRRRKDQQHAR